MLRLMLMSVLLLFLLFLSQVDTTLVRGGRPRAVLLQRSGAQGQQGEKSGSAVPGLREGETPTTVCLVLPRNRLAFMENVECCTTYMKRALLRGVELHVKSVVE